MALFRRLVRTDKVEVYDIVGCTDCEALGILTICYYSGTVDMFLGLKGDISDDIRATIVQQSKGLLCRVSDVDAYVGAQPKPGYFLHAEFPLA